MIPYLFFVILISKAPNEIHQNPRLKLPECAAFRPLLSQFLLGHWGSKSPNFEIFAIIRFRSPRCLALQIFREMCFLRTYDLMENKHNVRYPVDNEKTGTKEENIKTANANKVECKKDDFEGKQKRHDGVGAYI